MKVVLNMSDVLKVPYKDLSRGEVFLDDGKVYIRLDYLLDGEFGSPSVQLDTGHVYNFDPGDMVVLIHADLQVWPKYKGGW
jgi:hypothetical protein